MRSVLIFLLMLIIVSVQIVDLAVLDNSHSQASEMQAALDSDAEKQIPDGNTHCGDCDTIHHMSAVSSTGNLVTFADTSKRFQLLTQFVDDADLGPPVPPPLS